MCQANCTLPNFLSMRRRFRIRQTLSCSNYPAITFVPWYLYVSLCDWEREVERERERGRERINEWMYVYCIFVWRKYYVCATESVRHHHQRHLLGFRSATVTELGLGSSNMKRTPAQQVIKLNWFPYSECRRSHKVPSEFSSEHCINLFQLFICCWKTIVKYAWKASKRKFLVAMTLSIFRIYSTV